MEIIIIASALFGIVIGWVLGYSIKKAEVKDTKNLVDNLNKLTNKILEIKYFNRRQGNHYGQKRWSVFNPI